MHISDGILSTPVLLSGAALTISGTAIGLKKIDYDRIPQIAILSAAFFVGSLIHVPIGPASVHLILNGLMGIFLGWAAFPAILVGLLLQSILFQYGGITSLGVNCFNMAFPAVICFYLFQSGIKNKNNTIFIFSAFMSGFTAVLIGCVMVAISLVFTGEQFRIISRLIILSHLPVMLIEGLINLFCIKFLKSVKPEMLEVVYAK